MKSAIKVLIVDDDKASAQMLGELVKRAGFKAVVTNKATDALNIVRLQTVQAAIVDVLLPKMTGVELAEEFRKTKFGENPIILVSGIFKDKNFASDAQSKTGAVDFLFKPFAAEAFLATLNKALESSFTGVSSDVSSLLTKKLSSRREVVRSIEGLEQIKGPDFPLVLSFLLGNSVSGDLNIVDESGEIYGVHVHGGSIVSVDSTESQGKAILALISSGLLAQEDWDQFQTEGAKNFQIEQLIGAGLVSPHAISVATHEQIKTDLASICAATSLQVNFSAVENSDPIPKHAVSIAEFIHLILKDSSSLFTLEYLEKFYDGLKNHRIQANGKAAANILMLDQFKDIYEIKDLLMAGGSLEQVVAKHPGHREKVFRAIHLIVLSREMIFTDVNHEKNITVMLERYKKLYLELGARSPDQVMAYFGASNVARVSAFDKVKDEYIKSNNPETIKREGNAELTDLAKRCLELVLSAHAIMTNDERRGELFAQQKAMQDSQIKESGRMVAESLEMIKKGQFQQAYENLKQAETIHPTTTQFLITAWAEIKCGASGNKLRLQELLKKIEALPMDERQSVFYFMALGLVKKSLGDPMAAGHFEKVLQLDSQFTEARRELNSVNPGKSKPEKVDILTGDITQVVSQLFRRKAN